MTYTMIPKKDGILFWSTSRTSPGRQSPTQEEVASVVCDLRAVLPGFDSAQRIVACSHHAAPTVAFAFPPARRLWRSGPDGADLALLSVLGQ